MSEDLKKAIELAELAKSNIEQGGSTVTEQLMKSHVKQYTRSNGTVVKEHDDSRHPQIIGTATDLDTHNPKKAFEFTFNGKRYSHTGKEGKSMHDGRHVSEFEHADSGHRVWMDDGGSVHADSKEEADRHHKRGVYAEHDDSRMSKEELLAHADHHLKEAAKAKTNHTKTDTPKAKWHKGQAEKYQRMAAEHGDIQAPPQADVNRGKWSDLPDEENPKYALGRISSKSLGQAAKGKVDLRQKAKEELAARGVDEHGKWLGFDKAEKHHGVTTDHMGGNAPDHDDVMGNFQTLHHKVLGAIASGHTDPKRLAKEELANRGHDHDGNWIGFDKAAKLHKVE